MSFGERRKRKLPKIFDPYVYEEIYTWLRHKPTMNPLHFRDLLNPLDSNFRPPSRNLDDLPASEDSRGEPALHAYASAAAYDAAADSMSKQEPLTDDTEASAGGNQNFPMFPSLAPNRHQLLTFAPRMLRP